MDNLLQELREFSKERDWDQFHSPKNLSMALAVEVAELLEHFQWLSEEESDRLDPTKLAEVEEEIGDIQIYLARLADRLGICPLAAARAKLKKSAAKYPVDKSRGNAKKYTEL